MQAYSGRTQASPLRTSCYWSWIASGARMRSWIAFAGRLASCAGRAERSVHGLRNLAAFRGRGIEGWSEDTKTKRRRKGIAGPTQSHRRRRRADTPDSADGKLVSHRFTDRADRLEPFDVNPVGELHHHRPPVVQLLARAFEPARIPAMRIPVLDAPDTNLVRHISRRVARLLQQGDISIHLHKLTPWPDVWRRSNSLPLLSTSPPATHALAQSQSRNVHSP